MNEQRKRPLGISMAEAQRRAGIIAKVIRKHGHSLPISQMADESEHRCPVVIWPHDPSTRCKLPLFHGGTHISMDGTRRNGTASEQLEILGLAAGKFSDDLIRTFHLTRLSLWIAGAANWIERQLNRLARIV